MHALEANAPAAQIAEKLASDAIDGALAGQLKDELRLGWIDEVFKGLAVGDANVVLDFFHLFFMLDVPNAEQHSVMATKVKVIMSIALLISRTPLYQNRRAP